MALNAPVRLPETLEEARELLDLSSRMIEHGYELMQIATRQLDACRCAASAIPCPPTPRKGSSPFELPPGMTGVARLNGGPKSS